MLKNVLRSWILSLQDIGIMLKPSLLSTHNLWPEGASMPQTDFCMVGLRSKYHPATHQPQPFQTPNRLELHDPNFTTVWSMSWPGSNQRQPLCLPSVVKPAPGNFGITLLGHAICLLETPQTWLSCNWDVLLAVSCAWAPCTPTSLPCSRKWVNTLLIRKAEAKAWTARMTARASTSEPLVARTLIMKESRRRTGPFWFARFEHFNNAPSLQSIKISETKQWSRHTEKISFYILGDTQSNLHQFTSCGENYIIVIIDWHDDIDTVGRFDLLDMVNQHNILLPKMMYWHSVPGSMNMTTCLTQGPGHGECYYASKTLDTCSCNNVKKPSQSNLKSNLPTFQVPRPGDQSPAGPSHQRSTPLRWLHRPQPLHRRSCRLSAKLMSTMDSDCKAVAKASTPWNAFRFHHDAKNKDVNWCEFKKTISQVFGKHVSFSVLQNPAEQNGCMIRPTQTRLNVFNPSAKWHTSTVSLRRAESRTTTNNIHPLCFDAFDTEVRQIQVRDLSIVVQHVRQSPGRMPLCKAISTHHHNIFTLDLKPLHLGPFITAVIPRQIDVNDGVV